MIDGYEQPAFVTVLAVAVAFEGARYHSRGTKLAAIRSCGCPLSPSHQTEAEHHLVS